MRPYRSWQFCGCSGAGLFLDLDQEILLEKLAGDIAAEHIFRLIAGEAVDEAEARTEDSDAGELGDRGVRGGDTEDEEWVLFAQILKFGGWFDADGLNVRARKHEAVDFIVGAVDGGQDHGAAADGVEGLARVSAARSVEWDR